MFKFVSDIGNAAYKTATKTGIAAGTEQPPYPCALPLPVIEDANDIAHIECILDATFESVRDMLGTMKILNASIADAKNRKQWKLLDIEDKAGDMHMFSRPHVGPYNFAKATMTLDRVSPAAVFRSMHGQTLEARKRYSCHLAEFEICARNPELPEEFIMNDDDHLEELALWNTRDWYLEYSLMKAPPPIASRQLMFLVEKRYVASEDSYYIYGCSVDYLPLRAKKESNSSSTVRAIAMWGWELTPVGNTTMATYISCMNPNGWTPTFFIGWMKGAIAKELVAGRKMLYEDRDRELANGNYDMKRKACKTVADIDQSDSDDNSVSENANSDYDDDDEDNDDTIKINKPVNRNLIRYSAPVKPLAYVANNATLLPGQEQLLEQESQKKKQLFEQQLQQQRQVGRQSYTMLANKHVTQNEIPIHTSTLSQELSNVDILRRLHDSQLHCATEDKRAYVSEDLIIIE